MDDATTPDDQADSDAVSSHVDAATVARPRACSWVAFVRSGDERDEVEKWTASRGDWLALVAELSGCQAGRWDRALLFAVEWARTYDGLVVASYGALGDDPTTVALVTQTVPLMVTRTDAAEQEPPFTDAMRSLLDAHDTFLRELGYARRDEGRRKQLDRTGWSGGPHVPYGYEKDGAGGLRAVAHEIDAFAQAMTLRHIGASYDTVAVFLSESGVRLRRAKDWHHTVIQRALKRLERKGIKPAPLNNLAKLCAGLPIDSHAI